MGWRKIAFALFGVAYLTVAHGQQNTSIVVASTTSTEQSGLFSYLLPRFSEATGIGVKVVAVGTGTETCMSARSRSAPAARKAKIPLKPPAGVAASGGRKRLSGPR